MFELRPYRKSSVSYYNPFREMADLERSFWGDPDSRNALAEFKTDITTTSCWRPTCRASTRRTSGWTSTVRR